MTHRGRRAIAALALACLALAACEAGGGGRARDLEGPGALERSLGLEPRRPAGATEPGGQPAPPGASAEPSPAVPSPAEPSPAAPARSLAPERPPVQAQPPVQPPVPPPVQAREPRAAGPLPAGRDAPRPAAPPADEPLAAVDAQSAPWPQAPAVRVRLLDREEQLEQRLLGPPQTWVEEDRWRWSEERVLLAGVALLVWREQFDRADATRVTVALVNGVPGRGTAYFRGLQVEVEGKPVWRLEGQHCIVPRGILARRAFHGPDAARLMSWAMIRDRLPGWTPAWAGARCAEDLARLRTMQSGEHAVGPYRIGDPIVRESSSLGGSHGGWKVAPYGGGSLSWYAGAIEGWQLAEEQFLRTMARSPIAILSPTDLQPYNPRVEYWLGRTIPHELPGFRDAPDDWCEYGQFLFRFRPHSYSHLWRQVRDAAQLARYDAAARWFLLTSWHDCTLWLESGGAGSDNHLFWPLEKLVATTPPGQGAGWANRGFAHVVRCFLEAEPYLPQEQALSWRERLVGALRHVIVPGTGVAHANPRPDDLDPSIEPPTARAREVDLLGASFLPLGLVEEDADWRRFMAPVAGRSVSATFQIRPGMRSWADGRGAVPHYFPEYDAFRGDLRPYGGDLRGLMNHARTRPVGENPLDWTDPAVWHPRQPQRR